MIGSDGECLALAEKLPSLERMKETARTYLELVDLGRFDDLAPVLSETVVYQTIGRAPLTGASNLIQYYKETRVVGLGVHEVLAIIAEGNRAAVLLRMKAKLRDGTVREFGAVDLFSFEGEKIADIRTFTDVPPAPSELTSLRR